MSQCPTCKQELEPGARFCPHDGTPLAETAEAPTRTPSEATAPGRPAQSRPLELPVVVGGRYRLTEFRGGGGMARVYRAVDVTLEREVAVKLINPELRNETEFDARFQREARIASQLNDPHIVVVHDFGIDAQHGPFLVMEYLQGQSLRERLQGEGPLPLRAALQMGGQLFLALIHAHGKDIVHRDIKPDNVFLLNQSGVRLHVRVLDFGIARIYRRGEAVGGETLTSPGAVMGTPRYMSPEQLAGQAVDARSDLYSAALVIYEALTGKLPYTSGKKLAELCPETPPALQEVIDHCLRPDPAERPAGAVEVYLRLQELGKASGILLLPPGALDRLVADRPAGEPTVPYVPKAARPRRRLLVGLGLLGLLLAALVVGAVIYFRRSPAPAAGGGESLLGVRIGDARQEVVDRLKLVKGGPANPWARKHPPRYLGNVLGPEELGLPEDALNELDVQLTAEDRVCVIFYDDRVRAVVARRGATGGGVRVGDQRYQVAAHYPRMPEGAWLDVRGRRGPDGKDHGPRDDKANPPAVWVQRDDQRGIAFEYDGDRVAVITLYPPAAGP